MRNLIKTTAPIALAICLLSNNLIAQDAYTTVSKKVYDNLPAMEKNIVASEEKVDVLKSYPQVVSKFSLLFPAATNAQWVSANENIWVAFVNQGRKGSASFSTKGKVQYVITECNAQQLPLDLIQAIKKDYTSYQVFNAKEIKAFNTTAYQVILEGTSHFVTLKYTSAGLEETTRTTKTK